MKSFLMCVALVVALFCEGLFTTTETEQFEIVAEKGDTLWNICEQQYSKGEIRTLNELVWQTAKDNGLIGKHLQEGQVVIITIQKRK